MHVRVLGVNVGGVMSDESLLLVFHSCLAKVSVRRRRCLRKCLMNRKAFSLKTSRLGSSVVYGSSATKRSEEHAGALSSAGSSKQ